MLTVSERWSTLATRVLAPNPGPMTLDGTNTYVVRHPDSSGIVVVDPGPQIAAHLDAITAHGSIELILLTHHHRDHTESAATLSASTGAPVRASEQALCVNAEPLRDGEVIDAAGARIAVIATPGHTKDSVCFHLPEDGPVGPGNRSGSILTGDTILGRGMTVLAQPEHAVRDYVRSLELLRELPDAELVLPAHGPALPSLREIAVNYLAHRHHRIAQVEAALVQRGLQPSTDASVVAQITEMVYPHASGDVRHAAKASTRAQLDYLAEVAR